jgi:hypothetical protein
VNGREENTSTRLVFAKTLVGKAVIVSSAETSSALAAVGISAALVTRTYVSYEWLNRIWEKIAAISKQSVVDAAKEWNLVFRCARDSCLSAESRTSTAASRTSAQRATRTMYAAFWRAKFWAMEYPKPVWPAMMMIVLPAVERTGWVGSMVGKAFS